jgi:hypothetical protein
MVTASLSLSISLSLLSVCDARARRSTRWAQYSTRPPKRRRCRACLERSDLPRMHAGKTRGRGKAGTKARPRVMAAAALHIVEEGCACE